MARLKAGDTARVAAGFGRPSAPDGSTVRITRVMEKDESGQPFWVLGPTGVNDVFYDEELEEDD